MTTAAFIYLVFSIGVAMGWWLGYEFRVAPLMDEED